MTYKIDDFAFQELTEVKRKLDEVKTTSAENSRLSERVKTLERENETLRDRVTSVTSELETTRREQLQQKQTTRSLYESLSGKLSELGLLQDQLQRAMQHT